MKHTLSVLEQQDLKTLLSSQTFGKAIEEALNGVFRDKRGASTLEACAMAYNHTEGAVAVLLKLYALAEIKPSFEGSTARRLKPTNN
jgi:hypothetical protein